MSEMKVPPVRPKWTPMRSSLLCMTSEKRRPRPAVQYGPTALTVAANVRRFREARNMTTYALSGALQKAGRPITPSAVAKIERRERQVTADDLVALAVALDVSPAALLLPAKATDPVQLTETTSVSWETAWRWAHGESPATPTRDSREGVEDPKDRRSRFLRENQPYRDSSHINEIAAYLQARIDGPWHLEVDSTGEGEEGTLRLHSRRSGDG